MSSIEEQEDKFELSAVLIVAFVVAFGAIAWGIYCIVAKFSFFADKTNYNHTIDYYHGNQAVGQGLISIAFGVGIISGLFFMLRNFISSRSKYQIYSVIAFIGLACCILSVICSLLVLYKVI